MYHLYVQNDKRTHTNTQVIFAVDARKRLLKGMQCAAAAVGCTLGPKGKTVLIQQQGRGPIATKDGVSVSRAIRLKDPVERMGAELVCEAASQTNEAAGDGTTTATVLTASLVEEGIRLIDAGCSAREVCRGIERGASLVHDRLKAATRHVKGPEEIAQVATISANGDAEIGTLIASAMERVGRDGVITVEDAKGTSTTLDVVEGMRFDRGYLSPYFVTDNDRMRAAYDNAFVLVTDRRLSSLAELVPVLERVMQQGRSILIVADDVEGEALHGLVLNRARGTLQVVAVKAPEFGQRRADALADICVLTGASLVSPSTGVSLEDVVRSGLGTCKRFIVDARTTTVVGGGQTKDAVGTHVEALRSRLEDVTLSDDDRAFLRMRIARLSSGVAVVRVGGATEVEMGERRYRIEDALNATRAAAEEGIVPGGGSTLYACGAAVLDEVRFTVAGLCRDEVAGVEALARACQGPMRRIIENAGADFGQVVAELRHLGAKKPWDGTLGYNAATGAYGNLVEAGVIDPCKVTRTALQNAVSVAVVFLGLDAVVFDHESAENDS